MAYNLEDIELMISDLPRHRRVSDLDDLFVPQRKRIKANAWHLNFHTRPRKIINSLIEHFQDNPIISGSWIHSGIPYFLWDLKQFPGDKDVRRLMQIPNIELVRS
jgi:hypothetical protein